MKIKFISDKYRKTRGGYSRMLDIRCETCGAHICYYQKDGSGSLKKMYLDRIRGSRYENLQNTSFRKLPDFTCQKCKKLLGVPIIYEKEDCLAFRLFQDEVTKTIMNIRKV